MGAESMIPFGTKVIIKNLNAYGRIVAIVISEYGTRYEVRYFWEGRPEQAFFFEDELEVGGD